MAILPFKIYLLFTYTEATAATINAEATKNQIMLTIPKTTPAIALPFPPLSEALAIPIPPNIIDKTDNIIDMKPKKGIMLKNVETNPSTNPDVAIPLLFTSVIIV